MGEPQCRDLAWVLINILTPLEQCEYSPLVCEATEERMKDLDTDEPISQDFIDFELRGKKDIEARPPTELYEFQLLYYNKFGTLEQPRTWHEYAQQEMQECKEVWLNPKKVADALGLSLQYFSSDPELPDINPHFDDVKQKIKELRDKLPTLQPNEIRDALLQVRDYTMGRLIQGLCACENGTLPLSDSAMRRISIMETEWAASELLGTPLRIETDG